jgi:hypothetical protein
MPGRQEWVSGVIRSGAESRTYAQFPAVTLSEGFGVVTFALHAGGSIRTMNKSRWDALPIYDRPVFKRADA